MLLFLTQIDMEKYLKDLLIKDLSARLPYGVKFPVECWNDELLEFNEQAVTLYSINTDLYCQTLEGDGNIYIEDIKPYLLPLSSMSREQVYSFYLRFVENDISFGDFLDYWNTNSLHKVSTSIDDCYDVICFFCENQIDFNNLIPKGLALDATGLNIY